MAKITMMQGDSYPVPILLQNDGVPVTPDMVSDIEVCVGEELRKLYSEGTVRFDANTQQWYIKPTQAETLALAEDETYDVVARIKFGDGPEETVFGLIVGQITIRNSISEKVI